jgi:hypothetical protein
MREDDFPHPVSDPEAEGLPGTADDDSTAFDGVDSPRIADGRDPAALPSDTPTALGRFGTTADEGLAGESLDMKVAREVPDPTLADQSERPDVARSPVSVESFDAEPLDEDTDQVDPGTSLDVSGAVEAHADSPVSVYDVDDRPIGRLVQPDEGAHGDTEPDLIARDAGAAGGGPTAEESAIHESRPR